MFSGLKHFIHYIFGGDQHRPYTLVVQDGAFRALLNSERQQETDTTVLEALHSYLGSLTIVLEDGEHALDYDVAADEFHGLGTRHRKLRLVREGDNIVIYDGDTGLDENDAANWALYDALDDMLNKVDFMAIPENEGYQLEWNESEGKFRGFEGGDFGGAGATDQVDEQPTAGQWDEGSAVGTGHGFGASEEPGEPAEDDERREPTPEPNPEPVAVMEDGGNGSEADSEPESGSEGDSPDTGSGDDD